MIGVNLNLGDFASGSVPDWLANVASLTGTIYVGNQPWTFAIGQLADQTTWLSLQMHWDIWLTIKFLLGVCVEIVDGGPKGFGVVLTLSAGADWGIGKFLLWGTFGLIIGTWKTGSDSSGVEFWIGLGFKINLFWIFSFGAEINLMITYLGKHPWYMTLHAEIKIDTPWFLPDVTFTIDKTWQEPMPFDTSTLTQCLSSASGIDGTGQSATPLLVPGLAGALGDASFVYTFNQLTALNGSRLGDPHVVDIPIVSVDATIAIKLAEPVSNDSLIATTTYDGTTDSGVQTVQDISLRYGLTSIAVRRAPRFGSTAGVWSDLLTDAESAFSIGGTAPESITFAWDTDTRADGKLAPKRLLMNSVAPYSFATNAPQNDEAGARNDPGYPCCDPGIVRKLYPRAHVLEFSALPFGVRAPRSERFSGPNGAWWRWGLATPPAIAPGDPTYAGGHVARFSPRTSVIIGSVDLPEPAASAQCELFWDSLPGTVFLDAYSGATLVGEAATVMTSAGSTTLSVAIGSMSAAGITRLLLRVEMSKGASFPEFKTPTLAFASAGWSPLAALDIYSMSYVTLADVLAYVAASQRCKSGVTVGPPSSDASGKLAFLPNHDYEVVLTTTVRVWTKSDGPRELQLAEALYLRTKGLPGLNACPNVGDDIRRHVDSTYPMRRDIPLYRNEPCVLGFENSLSSILPIDRTPRPGDPPEKAQMFPLELNVDRVASLNGLKRLTVPSDDWIAAHRMNPYPRRYYVASPSYAISKVRQGVTHDPLVLRFEGVQAAVAFCGPPKVDHASQVLLHEPIGTDGTPGPWEATTGYRATVRQKDGPFTERSGFDVYDLGAFVRQADGAATAVLWSVDGAGNLVAPAAAGGRHYASCGELSWDHLQAHAQVDLRTANAAGIAVGVGDGTPVPSAMVATVEHDGGGYALVVRLRDGSGEQELGRASVDVTGPVALNVTAYDDVVRASVGDVVVDGPRGAVREGRVALVADGPAAFAGIAVGAIDIYSFDFITSRYSSFAEHLDSYDGSLPTLATGALGGTPMTAASVMATNAAGIASVMQAAADPQARQKLFDSVIGALAIGLRKAPTAVSITRLTDAGSTFGLLIESPEPISVTRDVALTITQHVSRWIPGPVVWPTVPLGAIAFSSIATAPPQNEGEIVSGLQFEAGAVAASSSVSGLGTADRIARVVSAPHGPAVEVYASPQMGNGKAGQLLETVPLAEAQKRPDLTGVVGKQVGSVGIVYTVGPAYWGHWEEDDVPVPIVNLSNGAETAILVLSQGGAPLASGDYTVHAVLDRDRWASTTSSDPEQHYHDERDLSLQW